MFKPCLITKGYYDFFGGSGVRKTSAGSSLQKPWRLWLCGVSLCSDSLIVSEDFPDVVAFVMIGDPHAEQPTDSENNETAPQKLLPVRFLYFTKKDHRVGLQIHSAFTYIHYSSETQNEGRVSTVGQSVGWSVGGFQHAGGLRGDGIWVLRNGMAFWHSNIQFRKTIVYWSCLIVCELGSHGLFFRLDSRSGMVWVWFPWGLQEERRRKPHGHQGVLPFGLWVAGGRHWSYITDTWSANRHIFSIHAQFF